MLPYFQHLSNPSHPTQFEYLCAYRHRVWTKVLPSPHGSVVQRKTYSTPIVQGNGGTPIFALKWVC